MYLPDLDSLLLIDSIRNYNGESALEIGSGTGLVSVFLTKNFTEVVSTEIDYNSLSYSKSKFGSTISFVCCDAATAIYSQFDLIVSNPPDLPDDELPDRTIHGGTTGIEKTIHFIGSAIPNLKRNGYFILVVSSLSDMLKLDKFIIEMKMNKKIINKKNIFYEILYVYELSFFP